VIVRHDQEEAVKKMNRKISLKQRRLQNPDYDKLTPEQKKKAARGASVSEAQKDESGNVITKAMKRLKEKVVG
jgi:hypothetical protein